MKKFYILLISTFLTLPVFAQYSWKPKNNIPGGVRCGGFGFAIGGKGYVGAGYNGANLNSVWEYNPALDSWTQKTSLPVAARWVTSFVIGTDGYVFGGITSSGHSNSLYKYNTLNNTWTTMASLPSTGRYGVSGFALNGYGYIVGGNEGSASGPVNKELWQYNPANNSWIQKAQLPVANGRYGISSFTLNGKGYSGFGYNPSGSGVAYSDFYEYDDVNNTWTSKASLPATGVHYCAGFVINGKIYAGTGMQANGIPVNNFYEYNSTTNTWATAPVFPGLADWLINSFEIGNIGYFVGGANNQSYGTSQVYEYSPMFTGIESNEKELVKVFPNPVTDYINIDLNENSNYISEIKIYNSNGQIVFSDAVSTEKDGFRILLNFLAEGNYYLTMYSGSEIVHVHQFVKIKSSVF